MPVVLNLLIDIYTKYTKPSANIYYNLFRANVLRKNIKQEGTFASVRSCMIWGHPLLWLLRGGKQSPILLCRLKISIFGQLGLNIRQFVILRLKNLTIFVAFSGVHYGHFWNPKAEKVNYRRSKVQIIRNMKLIGA